VTPTAPVITTAMFKASDSMDVDGWADNLTQDVDFRFGNAEPLSCREAVRNAIRQFFSTIEGIRHHIVEDWTVDDTVIQQLIVTYTRHDGTEVTVPAANILRLRDGLISHYKIYVDIAPLYTDPSRSQQ
jgi:ketosteroid isomerase-like protein